MITFSKLRPSTYSTSGYRACHVLVDGKRVGSIWKWEVGYQYLSNEDTASTTWHTPKDTLQIAMDDLIYLPLIIEKNQKDGSYSGI